ncbi:hypothetical protein OE749_14780 [Aestuariibacter sp. AA17]|uniref:Manganese efflux pump MntP n=1 Tax=Fluctibacter corallii TaxID=2984329 RepID=A0ABT3ABA7_9ALTE|nr:manganese efflux pump [Aestuariibacter sp. AA17]MCV2885955.1 hypothetical protein [Aestuariibacter sp. AA17]
MDFITGSVLMGLGIGADVALATSARVGQGQCWRNTTFWISGVTLTHTLFPMLGFALAYLSVTFMAEATPIIGIVAFVCIAVYLTSELREYGHPQREGSPTTMLVTLGLILAVSWDALWSGPAKSAQVVSWQLWQVWGSFVIAGAVVGAMAILSAMMVKRVGSMSKQANKATLGHIGAWVQFSVIGYFGLLALVRYTLNWSVEWWTVLGASFCIIATIMAVQVVNGDSAQRRLM